MIRATNMGTSKGVTHLAVPGHKAACGLVGVILTTHGPAVTCVLCRAL